MRNQRPVVIALALFISVAAPVAQQQPPAFRSRVTLVPVEVRVLDRNGKPIPDLTQADFAITENGVPQQIVQFGFHSLAPDEASVEEPLGFARPVGDNLAPQNRRTFLIVLGRGRQVGPVKGVDAAMRFVKDRLLPQDRVAILAYNRSTDFTTNHRKVVETLERYWSRHEWIESRLRHRFSGLAAVYGSPEIPAFIQKEIDAVFRVPGGLTARSVDATGIGDARELAADHRRNRDLIQRRELANERLANGKGTVFDDSAVAEGALLGASFDEYVQKSFDTMSDLGNLYAGIRYLRSYGGEKHLVFLAPNGLFLPRLENANSLAALANDARVTIDIIHTYEAHDPLAASTSKHISRLTGGTMMAARSGDLFFSSLDDATRALYLLGYAPSNGEWDGKYRRIEVKVNRQDARVLFRHGYFARPEREPPDWRQYRTYSRIATAANIPRDIDDLQLTVSDPQITGDAGDRLLSAAVRVAPGAIKLAQVDGSYVGKAEAVAFSGDRRQRLVGEIWQTLDFKLTEQNYAKFLREGVSYTIRMRVDGDPSYLKVILYDYTADLVGSAVVRPNKK